MGLQVGRPGQGENVAILVENPNSSTDQISRAISKDQVLSAKVLKMVNSPIYGFPGRIPGCAPTGPSCFRS